MIFPSSMYTYSAVDADEKLVVSPPSWCLWKPSSKFSSVICLIVISSLFPACFLAGRASTVVKKSGIELDPVSIVFQSNRTFLQRPSLESDQIWFSLYPADNGFFNYPTKKPLRSTFAGFHQLHCVDTLRRGYYEVHDSRQTLLAGADVSSVPPENITLDHVLHCIEYLRQSIMCHADTTIEAKDEYFHGVVGFGIAHSCRDWWQMVRWVDRRNAIGL